MRSRRAHHRNVAYHAPVRLCGEALCRETRLGEKLDGRNREVERKNPNISSSLDKLRDIDETDECTLFGQKSDRYVALQRNTMVRRVCHTLSSGRGKSQLYLQIQPLGAKLLFSFLYTEKT